MASAVVEAAVCGVRALTWYAQAGVEVGMKQRRPHAKSVEESATTGCLCFRSDVRVLSQPHRRLEASSTRQTIQRFSGRSV